MRSAARVAKILKVAHIIHHISARELRYRLPISESTIADLVTGRVAQFVDELRREDFPLLGAAGGEKSTASLITKLLAKKETHAAAIRDRIRFRFVVEQRGDIIPFLRVLLRRLVPFNYVMPGNTVNNLVNFTALVESHVAYRHVAKHFQNSLTASDSVHTPLNEFSGPSYEVINFIADIPVRVSNDVLAEDGYSDFGPVMMGLVEFQVVDSETDVENEAGENRHDAYKQRKLLEVRRRLRSGAAI